MPVTGCWLHRTICFPSAWACYCTLHATALQAPPLATLQLCSQMDNLVVVAQSSLRLPTVEAVLTLELPGLLRQLGWMVHLLVGPDRTKGFIRTEVTLHLAVVFLLLVIVQVIMAVGDELTLVALQPLGGVDLLVLPGSAPLDRHEVTEPTLVLHTLVHGEISSRL